MIGTLKDADKNDKDFDKHGIFGEF